MFQEWNINIICILYMIIVSTRKSWQHLAILYGNWEAYDSIIAMEALILILSHDPGCLLLFITEILSWKWLASWFEWELCIIVLARLENKWGSVPLGWKSLNPWGKQGRSSRAAGGKPGNLDIGNALCYKFIW